MKTPPLLNESLRTGLNLRPNRENRYHPFPLTDIQQAYCVGRTDALPLGQVGCHYYQEFEGIGLGPRRLESSFQRLIRRHDMLRAVVRPDGRQQILEEAPYCPFQILDLRGCTAEATARRLAEVRDRLSEEVFAPERWPLFAVHLSLLDGDRMRIALSFDLLMLDAQSLSLLIRDWERVYRSVADPPLALSFRDYVLWDLTQRQTGRYRQALEYWDGRLSTLPAPPDLPIRPAWTPPRGAAFVRRKGRLDRERWSRLKARGRQAGLTPSALLGAAFAEVLGTWSTTDRFLLNLTFCRRLPGHPQVEQLLGDFTTTLLLEVDQRPPTFAQRARRLQEQLSADLEHVAVSGVEVLRRLGRNRDGTPPLAPVVFTSLLGHTERQAEALFSSNWLGEVVHGISQTPQVSLDHQAWTEQGELVFHWDTREAEYPDGLLQEMFDAYGQLLQRLADDDIAWSDPVLSLIPVAQRERRDRVNATGGPISEKLLPTLFLDQALLRPDAPAVIAPDRTLTYGELEQRSCSLAHQLRALGAAPGRLIAVALPKSWEQIVAVLGILRAGAAYLPIDPDLPDARIRHLLQQGDVGIVLTRETDMGQVPTLPIEQVEKRHRAPDDLAYVLFTSGSSGQPKGVMIDHRGAVNTILDINRRFQVGPDDRVLALSSLSFDLSVYDIFGVLAAGGAVVLPGPSAGRDPRQWCELIRDRRVTIWNSVPALMRMLVEYAAGRTEQRLPSLRLVLLSGDWIPVSLPDQVRGLTNGAEVISLGGATEASIWSVLYPIGAVESRWPSIPYGKPMTNQTLHVLDDRLCPCPDWVSGGLYIGGMGLARGYWRNETETARRFVIHPRTGERLYRTGDRARYLPDGNLQLLGREDRQVKVQGYRVEPAEIESVLARHPSVREALVVAWVDRQGTKRLIAYVVAKEGGAAETWEAFLAEHLPRYMIPSAFICLDALPLSANGKVDRTRLPAPEVRPCPSPASAEPNELERSVLAIVREVLSIGEVRVEDRLSELGCTSIQLVQIHRRIQDMLGREIPVAEIFNHLNVRSLAARLAIGEEQRPVSPGDREQTRRNRAELVRRRKLLREPNKRESNSHE